jgi:hypothetical protein
MSGIRTRKIRYYEDPTFMTRAAVTAPAESDRLEHDWSHWTSRAIAKVYPTVPAEGAQQSLLPEEPPEPDQAASPDADQADAEDNALIRPQEDF